MIYNDRDVLFFRMCMIGLAFATLGVAALSFINKIAPDSETLTAVAAAMVLYGLVEVMLPKPLQRLPQVQPGPRRPLEPWKEE